MHIRISLNACFVWGMVILAWPVSIAFGQTHWQKHANNPVLSPDLHAGILGFSDPSLLFDGTTFHLWITGGGVVLGDTVVGTRTYCYTSTDGFSWQPNPANPVFREGAAGTWDSGHIETPSVVVTSEGYRLYYAATPDSMADEGALLKIGLATSPDGISWTRHPANPILKKGLPGSWDERQIESPCVIATDSLFYMWYSGVDIEWKIHVGLATSTDGVSWQKYPGNPVFSPAAGSDWDSVAVYAPQVRWLGDQFVMLYTGIVFSQAGYDLDNTHTGVAASDDGIHWTRVSEQPVLSGTPGAWDATGPYTLDWCEGSDQLLMTYASKGSVGIATSTIELSVELNESSRPTGYVLFQNYPNPFNPTTTIQYQIPKAERVTIAIYNLLGREVRTLADEMQQPGLHKIVWDGKDRHGRPVSADVYVVQMQAGEFSRSKKIVLLK